MVSSAVIFPLRPLPDLRKELIPGGRADDLTAFRQLHFTRDDDAVVRPDKDRYDPDIVARVEDCEPDGDQIAVVAHHIAESLMPHSILGLHGYYCHSMTASLLI